MYTYTRSNSSKFILPFFSVRVNFQGNEFAPFGSKFIPLRADFLTKSHFIQRKARKSESVFFSSLLGRGQLSKE